MRDLDAGILGSSRDTASAPRGRTEIELSQSTASVEPDREPLRSAHVPPNLDRDPHTEDAKTCIEVTSKEE